HHAFSSGAGRTSDGNGSHASTLKSPSYTKSVSWQHYRFSRYFSSTPSLYIELCKSIFIPKIPGEQINKNCSY
ncbi:hypothetical protein U0A84_20995, partial [Escherichia coli]|nr:hypothetical protein [Escherichia coli]MDY9708359.1 hypothetical protein [Escherichia coli]